MVKSIRGVQYLSYSSHEYFPVRSIYTSYRHFGIFGAIIIETAITCFCNINNMNYGFVQLLLLLFDLLLLLALFDGSLAKRCMYPYSLR